MKLLGKVFLSGEILLKTGLKIGGSNNDISIGGIENEVIKTAEGVPYIPGSSLKGKLRSLLEKSRGLDDVCKCGKIDCYVCSIFGVGAGNRKPACGSTRLYVRDAFLNSESRTQMEEKKDQYSELELRYTEVKVENIINRLTSVADHPRPIERVPAGARFDFNMVYNVFNKKDIENLKYLIQAIKMLEDDYLGASGSRGYGRIVFEEVSVSCKTIKMYEGNNQAKSITGGLDNFLEDLYQIFSCE